MPNQSGCESSVRTYAIIPARGGSKGVPDKNIRLLAGFPLIAYSIVAAKLTPTIDRVIVSTDAERIADMSRRFGADVPFMRPAALAQDRSPDRDFLQHAIQWFEQHEGRAPDYWVHLRPTTPLREPVRVAAAIADIQAHQEATALRSAHPSPESPFKWFLMGDDGFFCGLRGEKDMDSLNRPRQCFPTAYVPDGYVDVLKTAFIKSGELIHGNRMRSFISPFCHEVDNLEDFDALEFQLHKEGSPLLDYLRQHYA